MSKLGVIGLLSAELCKEKQRFVSWVEEVAKDVHSDEEQLAQVDEERVACDVQNH